jgi:SAM-dependent methyltransferase
VTGGRDRFAAQAEVYDDRTAIPAEAAAALAGAVAGLIGRAAGVTVEVGAGTGAVGRALAALPGGYLGLDRSRPMLARFRTKAGAARAALVLADAGRSWPLAERSVLAVVGVRSLHLLDPTLVAQESARVLRPGGLLLIGRVERDADDPRVLLRDLRPRHRAGGRPERTGSGAGDGGRRTEDAILARLRDTGATPLQPAVVVGWSRSITPAGVLAGWLETDRAAGALTAADAGAILERLSAAAAARVGPLDRPVTTTERLVLRGVRLP